ncbi:hypothetical protein EYF80_052183 [Liparis tanakae]|uniref:Uncharacterized protein n=1 Tax=Liparis tanakae TaxID=230148 RepID=A0A4Z2F8T4_9TELE|nr:hypothetical protein EYF80_052183 [Liparis tanakae]
MPSWTDSSRLSSAMMGNGRVVSVASLNAITSCTGGGGGLRWSSTLSMDRAIIFTPRFWNSSLTLQAQASSVVQTGVKSFGLMLRHVWCIIIIIIIIISAMQSHAYVTPSLCPPAGVTSGSGDLA